MAKEANYALCGKACCQQAERGDPSPLHSPGEATRGMLPDLGSPVQNTGLSPMQGHEIFRDWSISHMRIG